MKLLYLLAIMKIMCLLTITKTLCLLVKIKIAWLIIYEKLDEYASKGNHPFNAINQGEAAVGFIRATDNTIHCGNNVYIPKQSYDNGKVKVASRKDYGRFVKEIAMIIIGVETLKNSSVTGRKCNRTKSAPKNKIDPTLLGAVYGIFEYFLHYDQQLDPVSIELEKKHVGSYIAGKICDLNRKIKPKKNTPKRINVPENSLTKSDCDNSEQNETDDIDTDSTVDTENEQDSSDTITDTK